MKKVTIATTKIILGLGMSLALAGLLIGKSTELMAAKGATVIGEKPATMPWTPEIMSMIQAGDAKRGEEIAKNSKCKKCHGKTGISDENDTPNLAGLSRAYSFKQMFDYKYGRRKDKIMLRACEKISDQGMSDLAAWYETHKAEPMMGIKASKTIPVLADKGDMSRQLLACDTCHNKKGIGQGLLVPKISGQKRQHFIETMMMYKESERTNDDYGVMRFIAERLSDDEIENLALYYGSKPLEED